MRDEALEKIQEAKLSRLEILEIQIATVGETHAEPSQITERNQLKNQLGLVNVFADSPINDDPEMRQWIRQRDQKDLNAIVWSGLVTRVTNLEEWIAFDRASRPSRQRVLNIWLGLLSIGMLLIIGKLFL